VRVWGRGVTLFTFEKKVVSAIEKTTGSVWAKLTSRLRAGVKCVRDSALQTTHANKTRWSNI
jgi:hypothetical protein